MSRWSVPFEFSFFGGKTRFTHAVVANKRANSHNFKIKNLNLLTITFLAVYLMNKGKASYVNESSMRANNTFREIIDYFLRKHCRDRPCQTSSVVFQIFLRVFFLTLSLIDRCQIATDICKNNVSNFVGSLLNHPYHYASENVSVKYLSLICLTSTLTTIYSLKNCSVYGRSCRIYGPKSFGFFQNVFHYVKKNNVIYRLRVGPYGKKL